MCKKHKTESVCVVSHQFIIGKRDCSNPIGIRHRKLEKNYIHSDLPKIWEERIKVSVNITSLNEPFDLRIIHKSNLLENNYISFIMPMCAVCSMPHQIHCSHCHFVRLLHVWLGFRYPLGHIVGCYAAMLGAVNCDEQRPPSAWQLRWVCACMRILFNWFTITHRRGTHRQADKKTILQKCLNISTEKSLCDFE